MELFSFFAVLIASPTIIGVSAVTQDVAMTNKENLIWTSFVLDRATRIYRFDGQFQQHRIEQLLKLYKDGGSVQSNDALEYEEYKELRKARLPSRVADKFKSEVNRLRAKVTEFAAVQGRMELIREPEAVYASILCCQDETTKREHQLAAECKMFLWGLLAEGEVSCWLDVFSFMRSTEPEHVLLSQIFQIASIQSAKLDVLVLESMFELHDRNAPRQRQNRRKRSLWGDLFSSKSSAEGGTGRSSFRRAVIEGAGPIGLYAALQFFLAGMQVALVNDRGEHYKRSRTIYLDQRWMTQLRIFLGTRFDEMFVDGRALGKMQPGQVGQLSLNELEDVLKERLAELASYVKHRTHDEQRFALHYESSLDHIEYPTRENGKQCHAILGAKRGGGPSVEESSPFPKIPFDLLVCAGGANDRIRNEVIGKPEVRLVSKHYGVAVFRKGNFGIRAFPNEVAAFNVDMEAIRTELEAQRFDEEIARNVDLSPEIKQKYARFTDQLIEREVDASDGDPPLSIRMFENRATIDFFTVTPPAMAEFYDDLDRVKRSHPEKSEAYSKLHLKFDRKWFLAVFDFTLAQLNPAAVGRIQFSLRPDGEPGPWDTQKMNFHQDPVNTASWWLTITAMQNAVGQLRGGAALAIAVGDANASPHFKSASGISTGRMGVEKVAQLVSDYLGGSHIKSVRELAEKMRRTLLSVAERVVRKAGQFVKLI